MTPDDSEDTDFISDPLEYPRGIVTFYVPSIFAHVGEDEETDFFETPSGIELQVECQYFDLPAEIAADPCGILADALDGVEDKDKPELLETGFGFASYSDDSDVHNERMDCAQLRCVYAANKQVSVLYSIFVNVSDRDDSEIEVLINDVFETARLTSLTGFDDSL